MVTYPKPNPQHLVWSDCEIGVLIHYDIQVFRPEFDPGRNFGKRLPTSIFNPVDLDTDQWVETAVKAGAKYAILTAKHGTGFSLWPTKAHDYHVANTPYGKDIVRQFIESCHKYAVRPGLYYHCSFNGFLAVDNPGRVISSDPEEQKAYRKIVETQVEELWSQYGPLFEIWFDGGILPVADGEPDILNLLLRYQPDAVCFQGPVSYPALVRWVGNEDGVATYPCWSTPAIEHVKDHDPAMSVMCGTGDPDGSLWVPAETDTPVRKDSVLGNRWMWLKDEEGMLRPVEELIECYYTSVGCNTNLLLGMVVDDRGLVPQADVDVFARFGDSISSIFAESVGEGCGTGYEIKVDFNRVAPISQAILMEDIKYGERVRKYDLFAMTAGGDVRIAQGTCMGHKRIERFPPIEATGLKLIIKRAIDTPIIRSLIGY